MRLIKENKLIGLLLYSIMWFLFLLFIFENSFEIIDPCASTPSTELTAAFYIIPVTAIVFFLFLYHYITDQFSKTNKFIYSISVLTIIPAIATFISYKILNSYFIKNLAEKNNLDNNFYTLGCYNDMTVNSTPLYILNAFFVFIFAYLLFLSFRKKSNN